MPRLLLVIGALVMAMVASFALVDCGSQHMAVRFKLPTSYSGAVTVMECQPVNSSLNYHEGIADIHVPSDESICVRNIRQSETGMNYEFWTADGRRLESNNVDPTSAAAQVYSIGRLVYPGKPDRIVWYVGLKSDSAYRELISE